MATPAQVAGKTGKEILQAIIDGELPQGFLVLHQVAEQACGDREF